MTEPKIKQFRYIFTVNHVFHNYFGKYFSSSKIIGKMEDKNRRHIDNWQQEFNNQHAH